MTGVVGTQVAKDGNLQPITGNVRMFDASGTGAGPWVPMQVPSDLNGGAIDLSLPSQVVGSVASASADSGNPVKVGGKYNSALPTFTDGNRADLQLDNHGNARAKITALLGTATDTGSLGTNVGLVMHDGNNSTTGILVSLNGIWNGTTVVPQRKANAVSRIASSAASVNATSAKAAAGDVYKIIGNNTKASVIYFKLYNKASAPTVGTDTPFLVIPIPASAVFNISIVDGNGLFCSTGIAYGFTTDAADNGTTALSSGDILDFNLIYG